MDDSFEKGDHCRAPRLHLHYIWPRGKPGGAGPSPELANEKHWVRLITAVKTFSSQRFRELYPVFQDGGG